MKRVFLLLLPIIFIFSSCKSEDVKSSISLNLDSLNTAFSLNDESFEGTMKLNESNEICVVLSSPEIINGLTFTVSADSVKSTYDGVAVSQNSVGIFSEFYDAIQILKSATNFTPKDGFYEFSSDDFNALLDARGNLISLQTENGNFKFT